MNLGLIHQLMEDLVSGALGVPAVKVKVVESRDPENVTHQLQL